MAEHLSREERKEEYERLLGVIEHNTGGKQPALASVSSISQIAASIGIDDPRKRLRAAVENDDVVTVGSRVCLAEPEAIRAAIEEEVEREHPRQDRIGWLNQVLQEVTDGE